MYNIYYIKFMSAIRTGKTKEIKQIKNIKPFKLRLDACMRAMQHLPFYILLSIRVLSRVFTVIDLRFFDHTYNATRQ